MKLGVIVALSVGVAVVGGVVWRLTSKVGAPADKASGKGKGSQTSTVEVATAGPATIETYLRAVGSVQSPFKVQLSPKTAGRIEFLQAREGDAVHKGDVLVRIDPSQAAATVAQQRSNLAEAQSRYTQALLQEAPNTTSINAQIEQQGASLMSAEADLNQVRRNYDSQVQAAKSQVSDAEAKLRSAQSGIDVANANLEKEKANLANAQIKYDRAKGLADKGYVPESQVEDTRTALEVQSKAVSVAKAQLNGALQSLNSAKAQVDVANQNLKVVSQKGLSDIAASQAKRDQAASSLKVAKANSAQNPAYKQNLAALSASVKAAQAQLSLAEVSQSDTVLRSTIDGFVTARNGDVGSLAQPGQSVLTVEFMDWMFFSCSLPIDEAPNLKIGMTVRLALDSRPGETINGTVKQINPSADPSSRQFTVLIRLENSDHSLKTGMFGQARLVMSSVDAAVAVPKEAIRKDAKGNPQVAIVGDDGKVKLQAVTLGVQNETLAEIKTGLNAGAKVVTLAYGQLKDDQTVALPGAKKQGGTKGGGKAQ